MSGLARDDQRRACNGTTDAAHIMGTGSGTVAKGKATAAGEERAQKLMELSMTSTSLTSLTTSHRIEAPAAAPPKKRDKRKAKKTAEETKLLPLPAPKKVNAVTGEPITLPRLITKEKLLGGLDHLYQDGSGVWRRKQRFVGEGGEVIWVTEEESEAAAVLMSMFESCV